MGTSNKKSNKKREKKEQQKEDKNKGKNGDQQIQEKDKEKNKEKNEEQKEKEKEEKEQNEPEQGKKDENVENVQDKKEQIAPKPDEDKADEPKPEQIESDDKEKKEEKKEEKVEQSKDDKPDDAQKEQQIAPKDDDKNKEEQPPKNNDKNKSEEPPKVDDKNKEQQPPKDDDKELDKKEDIKSEDDKKEDKKVEVEEDDKPKLKPIEYPTKEDQQLRYIYQTIKPAKDAEKYLTPKHFQDFLLNESAEMLNDEVMLLFRDRIKQTIKFHKIPDGAWQGWYTKSKDYAKITDILKEHGNNSLNVEVEEIMKKSGETFEKKDSNLEIRISSRTIRGSGRDEHGNFSITGAFRGSDWSSHNASEFAFDKSYPGKHTVKYHGTLHDDLSLQGFWVIPSLKLGGFFY